MISTCTINTYKSFDELEKCPFTNIVNNENQQGEWKHVLLKKKHKK